jgi:outer membrane murein-binding lipoprotein Lpp
MILRLKKNIFYLTTKKMKKVKFKFILAAIVVGGILFAGCEEDDVNPNGKIKLQVETTSSTTVNFKSTSAANDLVFDSGTITIREVVFDGEADTVSVSRTIEQIAEIDYASGDVSPEVVIGVPAGDYTGVNLGIELQDENNEPTVVTEGTYTNSSGEAIPIRFEFNSGEVFEANAESVKIEAGADLIGKITFDAISWFATVSSDELDNATLSEGTIIVSGTSNAAIFDKVADKLDVDTQAVFE